MPCPEIKDCPEIPSFTLLATLAVLAEGWLIQASIKHRVIPSLDG